jgi:hypothetical protein
LTHASGGIIADALWAPVIECRNEDLELRPAFAGIRTVDKVERRG